MEMQVNIFQFDRVKRHRLNVINNDFRLRGSNDNLWIFKSISACYIRMPNLPDQVYVITGI